MLCKPFFVAPDNRRRRVYCLLTDAAEGGKPILTSAAKGGNYFPLRGWPSLVLFP